MTEHYANLEFHEVTQRMNLSHLLSPPAPMEMDELEHACTIRSLTSSRKVERVQAAINFRYFYMMTQELIQLCRESGVTEEQLQTANENVKRLIAVQDETETHTEKASTKNPLETE